MDFNRQLGLLNPQSIGAKSVAIIGAGATGSHAALYLAQMGWGDTRIGQGIMRVFDGDTVSEHNLPNQVYEKSHIGKPKVDALKEIIIRKCGFEIEAYNEMVVDQPAVQANYVLLLTDTMSSRKEIFEKCLQFSFKTDLVVETRMGLTQGRVYSFCPANRDEVDVWAKTLYSDSEAEVSMCGASASILSTTTFLASVAVGRVIHHFNLKYGDGENRKRVGERMWNVMQFSLYPEEVILQTFDGRTTSIAQMNNP